LLVDSLESMMMHGPSNPIFCLSFFSASPRRVLKYLATEITPNVQNRSRNDYISIESPEKPRQDTHTCVSTTGRMDSSYLILSSTTKQHYKNLRAEDWKTLESWFGALQRQKFFPSRNVPDKFWGHSASYSVGTASSVGYSSLGPSRTTYLYL